MILDYKEIEQSIQNIIMSKKEELKTRYITIDEAEEYGYNVVFEMDLIEDSIKAAFEAGRAIGTVEGEIDQLVNFQNFLYKKEFDTKEE